MKQAGRGRQDTSELEALRREVKELRVRLETVGDVQGQREFWQRLGVLHQMTNELARAETYDELCRRAVELGRARLGFDRLGLWFVTDQPGLIRGSFGIDEKGRIRDERGHVIPYTSNSPMGIALARRTTRALVGPAELRDHRGEIVGRGTAGYASIWDGERVIGCVSTDNLLRGGPITPVMRELLNAFASALGPLCARARALEALRASDERVRAVVGNIRGVVYRCACDAARTMDFISDYVEDLTGYPASDFLGNRVRSFADLVHPEDAPRLRQEKATTMAARLPYEIEYRIMHRDGSTRWVRDAGTPVSDDDGRIKWCDGAMVDITESKEISEQLARSELLYRTTIDGLDDSVHVVTPDLRITLGNRAFLEWCRELGLGDDMVGRPLTEACPFFDEKVFREYREVFETGEAMLTEEVNAVGGREIVTETRKMPILQNGKAARVITVVRDVTEARQAERALRQSEQQMRLILENSTDGINIAVLDLKTTKRRLMMCNDRYVEMTGRTREELMAADDLNALTVYHETPEELAKNNRRLMKGIPYRGLASWNRPDGKENYFEWTAAPIRRGDEIYIVGIDRDVTERRRAEQELLVLEYAVRSSISAIALMNLKGRLTYVNPSMVSLWGYDSAEEAMANPPEAWWADRRAALRVIRAIRQTGSWTGEMVAVRKDGTRMELAVAASLVGDREGRPVCLMSSFLDISARKRAEEAMQAAHRKLTAAREAERRRLAGELHDSIGQGLVALQLGLRGMAREVHDDGDRLAAMATQCETLIREVRALCRGLYPPTLESLGLCPALKQLAEDFKSQARITVTCSPQAGPDQLSPDVEIALFRITQEAVSNAIRHGHARRIDLELTRHQGAFQLTVTDDGSGFDPDRAAGGQGLGLNMMSERALAIGGELAIESEPGRTRVTARVPGAPPRPADPRT